MLDLTKELINGLQELHVHYGLCADYGFAYSTKSVYLVHGFYADGEYKPLFSCEDLESTISMVNLPILQRTVCNWHGAALAHKLNHLKA